MTRSPLTHHKHTDRRRFLQSSALAGCSLAAGWWLPRAEGRTLRQAKAADYPFQLGVASGDPLPDGVVLWTRLAPAPLADDPLPAENIAVRWVVAHDEALQHVVAKGEAVAVPALGHSVHVEATGLQPDRWYFYQFHALGESSPVGRTRTTPRQDVLPDRLRMAFASCQNYEQGLFTAYQHMAREDLDLIFHLGDYIYEYAAGANGKVRQHVGAEIATIDDYRRRHSLYRLDEHLQAAHQHVPWVMTWDDHEVDNNYANQISEEQGIDPAEFLKRRAIGYQAYYEHMPLRSTSMPTGHDMQLYRWQHYGRLAQFAVLDTRQFRTDQPCADGVKPRCDACHAEGATLLGTQQEEWLKAGQQTSQALWNPLAQQVMMGDVNHRTGDDAAYSMDQWSGYPANRTRLLEFWRDAKISNPVVMTGDIHSNWVNNLQLDPANPDDAVIATEFVGTSISSGGNGGRAEELAAALRQQNPFVKFFNAERGYVSCEITPREWTSHYRVVENVEQPGAPLITRNHFVVEAGNPGALLG